MLRGKCPKCEGVLTFVKVVDMPVKTEGGTTWKGAAFICPLCFAILSTGIDPHALKGETVDDIVTALQK